MPCAYVLASSARQDEEQALACQPLPMTPETLTSLSWKQDWVRLLIDSGWAEGGRCGEESGKDPTLETVILQGETGKEIWEDVGW